MNFHSNYSKDNSNLYSDYVNNFLDTNNSKQNINQIKEDKEILYSNQLQINSQNIMNKKKFSFNNIYNNNNNKKSNNFYKSFLDPQENNSFIIANNNKFSKNKEEYIYQTYNNNKNNKYLNSINIKKSFNDNNKFKHKNMNKQLLSQSLNKYDNDIDDINDINDIHDINDFNIKSKFNNLKNKSINKNQLTKLSTDSFYKNYYDNDINKLSQKETTNKSKSKSKNENLIIKNDTNNNKEIFMDKSEFFRNIKEIQDLDSIDLESSNAILDINNNDIPNLINSNDNEIINEGNKNNGRNSLKVFNKPISKNIHLNNLNNNKLNSEKKEVNNLNYNRVSLKNKNNNSVIKTSEKKQNSKISKRISEKVINNLTDNKRNNYLNNLDFNDTFSNSNIKRENLNNFYNYEIDTNNVDISKNYQNFNDLISKNDNINKNILEKKFSKKLNISPYNKKRFSTLTNNKDDIEKDELNLNNDGDIINNFGNSNIYSKNYEEIYNKLLTTQKINMELNNKINTLNKIIKKKNSLIKNLYSEKSKNQKTINDLMKDNKLKQNLHNKLITQIKKLNKEIYILKMNREEPLNIKNNDNKYIKEIKELKKRINNCEIENNKLKLLLFKNKERQYSNDISRKDLRNSLFNYSEKNIDSVNFVENNKSLSMSRFKNKINIDKSISKKYKEDKDIKSQDEKSFNLQIIKY